MPTFKAILFDLGNTLIYFDGDWGEVLAEADGAMFRQLQEAGIDLDENSFRSAFRAELQTYYREREMDFIEYTTFYVLQKLLTEWGYPDLSESVLRPALNALYAVTQAYWHPDPLAIPLLETLRIRGYQLGLISNAGDDLDVQVLVDKAGLRPLFDLIVTSAALGIRKPNPEIFRGVLRQIGAAPSEAAMVGDMLGADVLGAQNAGVFSIWLARQPDHPANQAHRETIHPQAVIYTLNQLPALLERLAKE